MEEFRDINNYFPFVLPVKTIPMLFVHNLEKKYLTVEIKSYLDDTGFNSDHDSNFDLLSDKATFQGSLYEGVLQTVFPIGETFADQLEKLADSARLIAKFQNNDVLKQMKVDSEEPLVEINGERILGDGIVDLDGDPSKTFSSAQNKFERLKQNYPELTQLLYLFVLSVFAVKESPKQKFFQAVLANALK